MRSRRLRHLIICLIALTALAACIGAATKLRETPMYDRIQIGMTGRDVEEAVGHALLVNNEYEWDFNEGRVHIDYEWHWGECSYAIVKGKSIERRSPLERLARMMGWQSTTSP